VPEFSLDLTDEQRELRDWTHGFAAGTVRPAAADWDAREETPWPLIQEAAKIGLYSFEFLATCWADPTGLSLPIASEELFWGDAGIAMSILGTGLAVAAIYGSGTPEQLLEWVPQCFGDPDDPKVAAFCSTEPEAGSDVAAIRTRARYDEARDEWVLSGQKAYATNGGIANVHVVTASVDPPRTRPTSSSTRSGYRGAACSVAGRRWRNGWPGRARQPPRRDRPRKGRPGRDRPRRDRPGRGRPRCARSS
jgi:alkylation response protein AidB-like acyl-CoA dehydrogenase